MRWLRKNGIRHYIRADGRPSVPADDLAEPAVAPEPELAVERPWIHPNERRAPGPIRRKAVALSALLRERFLDRPVVVLKDSAAHARERKRAVSQATPAWANLEAIKAIYVESRRQSLLTGIEHHVDHIVPIKGRIVCGLHVEVNLRIIPATDNVRRARVWQS